MHRLATTLILAASALSASEREFSYVQPSAVLAPGQHEVELWTTWQGGREGANFQRVDSRIELEVGLVPDTQAAFYLNLRRTSIDGVTESEFEGASFELKHRLTDPAAGGPGVAVYGELTLNGGETELEGKAIVDGRSGNWSAAANASLELEWEQAPDESGTGSTTEMEVGATLSAGLSRQLGRNWHLGIEVENRNPIAEGTWESSTLWAGPVVHLAGQHAWGTLTVLPQLTNLGGEAETGTRDLTDSSRVEVRLLIGIPF